MPDGDRAPRTFKLHLPGLLKVLAEHLYTSKDIAIRELLQNAHDSCMRRLVEDDSARYQPRIDVALDATRQRLTISDNGYGLTGEEVEGYLATIGRSYTRELRERLSLLSHDQATALVGQFGFGFLSAFLIASEVVVTTRSALLSATAWRWSSDGDEHYRLEPTERADVGTTVELQVKQSAAFLLQRQLVTATIQKYADFLPIPIYVDGAPYRVNLVTPPWDSVDTHAACVEYIARAFEATAPLYIDTAHKWGKEVLGWTASADVRPCQWTAQVGQVLGHGASGERVSVVASRHDA
jgi:molecular chaperone HtpG